MHTTAATYSASMGASEPTIGRRIRSVYLRKGYNRNTFAKALDVHYTTLDAWERGTQIPRRENVALAAELLGVPEAELYGYVEPMPEYAAYKEWAASPEGQFAKPEIKTYMAMQRWPKEPTALTYHYMFHALLAQVSPENAARAAETTEQARENGIAAGGKPRTKKGSGDA